MTDFSIFNSQPIIYGISEKADGPMNFSQKAGEENRRKFLEKRGLKSKLILPRLEHGNKAVLVDKSNVDSVFRCDALITKEKDILFGVTVADCFPVYFLDPHPPAGGQAIGIAHCGWRGIVGGIVPNVIAAFQENFGSRPGSMLLAIGPGLRFCHFAVQNDIIGQFAGYEIFIEKKDDGYHVDLEKIIHWQAMKAGVRVAEAAAPPSANVGGGGCTFENENYFSWRRDRKEPLESMMAYIQLADD